MTPFRFVTISALAANRDRRRERGIVEGLFYCFDRSILVFPMRKNISFPISKFIRQPMVDKIFGTHFSGNLLVISVLISPSS